MKKKRGAILLFCPGHHTRQNLINTINNRFKTVLNQMRKTNQLIFIFSVMNLIEYECFNCNKAYLRHRANYNITNSILSIKRRLA
jgi:hypothetical protein